MSSASNFCKDSKFHVGVASCAVDESSWPSTALPLQVDDRPTRLALAIAEYGRIEKTIHTLNFIDDEFMRRATLAQLNFGEGRHALARDVFHGKRGELHQRYREGQDQLSALGLVINMIVYWNTLYMNAALVQLCNEGYSVRPEDEARRSPFGHDHINIHRAGRGRPWGTPATESLTRGRRSGGQVLENHLKFP